MKMPKLSSILIMVVIVLAIILAAGMFLSGAVGQKTISDDTVVLPPGGQKVFNSPPGFVVINMTSSTLIDENIQGLGVSGEGHNINRASSGIGSVFGASYTVINPGNADASVDVSMTTGMLNPFAYV